MTRSRILVALALLVITTVQVVYAVPTAATARMGAAHCCLRNCEPLRLTANRQCCHVVQSPEGLAAGFPARDRPVAVAVPPSELHGESLQAPDDPDGARHAASGDRVSPIFLRTLSLRL